MPDTAAATRRSSCCYFTIKSPPASQFSTETPSHTPAPVDSSPLATPTTPADPTNPLLAYRASATRPISSPPFAFSQYSFLQMQTAAAHGQSPRPRPIPTQNVLHVTSDDETMSSPSSGASSLDLARCSRCQRTPSIDVASGKSNMVQYGLNLWYCSRCAALVGLKPR